MCCSCPDLLLILLSIIFPPFGALIRRGCGADFLINCGLTALGYLPGLIHSWYLICKYPSDEYEMLVDDDEYPRQQHQHHHVIVIGHSPVPAVAGSSSNAPLQQQNAPEQPPPYQSMNKNADRH
ncbi:hypothetical protein LPJ66_008106 [Kickxella alabastrina]|uniref:Uncharacterized protein n=1 Tax=Kickxella alabastrina TaxID=61397 RepID=A0ACC1IAT2_9FUNG|nr:hypothetical protein LPJ66_008106 [Kickxella alabastrina]